MNEKCVKARGSKHKMKWATISNGLKEGERENARNVENDRTQDKP